jgi:SAM-dependent methyltransferase
MVESTSNCPEKIVLDAGCGTAGLISSLGSRMLESLIFGLEINPLALELARSKSSNGLIQGSVNQLPLVNNSVDVALSIDVLYHKAVLEDAALSELYRCLKPGGYVLIHSPAYNWLYSYHDKLVHTRKRYTATQLHQALSQAGFLNIRTGYRLAFLLPLFVIRRTLLRRNRSDVHRVPILLDRFLYQVTCLENHLHQLGFSLPFGSSVWALARKNEQ